jgi:hypothetical protein
VVVTWANPGTIHLLRPDYLPWLLALSAPTQQAGIKRRLEEHDFGVDTADRAACGCAQAYRGFESLPSAHPGVIPQSAGASAGWRRTG